MGDAEKIAERLERWAVGIHEPMNKEAAALIRSLVKERDEVRGWFQEQWERAQGNKFNGGMAVRSIYGHILRELFPDLLHPHTEAPKEDEEAH